MTPAEAGGPSIRAALATATADLAASSDSPRLDAELLMAHAVGVERPALLAGDLSAAAPAAFAGLVARRRRHEPVAYIVGTRGFWTFDLMVTPAVLIPRPDSETLIAAALARVARPPRRLLDLGTGSGALLLAALSEWPDARGVGVDRSAAALAVARANARALDMAGRTAWLRGDWGTALAAGAFDLILCNPPYVETDAALAPDVADHEPASALFAGPEGLDDYRRLVPDLPRLLAPGGLAVVEIGWTQADAVVALLREAGLITRVHRDLGDRDRAISAHLPE